MRRTLRDAAGLTAAWTVMGLTLVGVAAATAAVGALYLLAAGAHQATTTIKSRKGPSA